MVYHQIKEIIESPNRENIKLSIKEYRESEKLTDLFDDIIEHIIEKRMDLERMLTFIGQLQIVVLYMQCLLAMLLCSKRNNVLH